MTALTIEQKRIQYSRELAAYTQNQYNAVRKRQGVPKGGQRKSRSPPESIQNSGADSTGSEDDDLRTPKPDGNGQFQMDEALSES